MASCHGYGPSWAHKRDPPSDAKAEGRRALSASKTHVDLLTDARAPIIGHSHVGAVSWTTFASAGGWYEASACCSRVVAALAQSHARSDSTRRHTAPRIPREDRNPVRNISRRGARRVARRHAAGPAGVAHGYRAYAFRESQEAAGGGKSRAVELHQSQQDQFLFLDRHAPRAGFHIHVG